MLHIEGLRKRYGDITAVDGISLQVGQGEFFGLLGPNGAGKSTLMSLVANILPADAGEIRINDTPIRDRNPRTRAALGLAPQAIALYKDLTAYQNLSIFGELYGLKGSVLRARIDTMLQAVQLADRAHEAVGNFS